MPERSQAILVVEDEAITAMAIKGSLTSMGYSVVGPVPTGEEAIQLAREIPVDLALMDIRLAGQLSGTEAASILRRDNDIPVIYLTAYSDPETLQGAKISEPYGYVVKPYEDRELHAAVEVGLHSSALGRERRVAQQTIERRDKLLRDLVDNSSALVYMTDAEGRYTLVNEAFERALGASRLDVVGKTSREALPASVASALHPRDMTVLATGESMKTEERISQQDGDHAYAAIRFPVRDFDGATLGLCAMWTDITEIARTQDALRASEARYRQLLEILPDAVALTTLGGAVRYASSATEGLLGYAPGELAGRAGADFVHPEDLLRVLATPPIEPGARRPSTLTYRLLRKDGSNVWVESRIQVVHDDATMKEPLLLSITRDIIERKRAEEEIERLNADLERRVAERTRDLQRMNEGLEAFTRSLSHDFAGHVRRIEQLSEAAVEEAHPALSAPAREILDRVHGEASRLRRLLGDLLAATRAAQAGITRVSTDLSQLARDVVASLAQEEPARRVEIRIKATPATNGDPLLLRLALENLLRNAWKYTSKAAEARIEFGHTTTREGEEAFFVRDNGIGFDPGQAHRLFQPFQRLAPAEYEGTGLGLSSVKHIIERHGGRVWAEGKPGEGATFFFTLPDQP